MAETEKQMTRLKLPDFSVVMGNQWIGGDNFANLPQNGNDAASLILKDAQYRRLDQGKKFLEAAAKEFRRFANMVERTKI
ncbi:hypothetical protein [Solidesulfovibrio sp.]